MRLLPALFLIGQLGIPCFSAAQAIAPGLLLQKIRRNKIDANAVYRVRELSFTREDVRFYFTEGMLAMLEPIEVPGRPSLVTGAIFVGEGETLVMPPDISEKRNLAHFVGTPVLNEKLTAVFLRFGDDTAAQLAEGIKEHTVKGGISSAEFVEQWGSVVQNLDLLYDLRLLNDLLTPPGSSAAHPFFSAHLFGQKLGAFDISIDPLAGEQVSVGQVNWKDGRRYTDLWLSFQSASERKKAAASDSLDPIQLRTYRIDTTIDSERQLDVRAAVDFDALLSGPRMVSFQLSRFLKISSAEMEGTPLTVYQNEGESEQRSNDVITLLLPAPLERGKHYTVSFRYSGGVIADAGHGVLYVGARGNWYPQRGYRPARYDLTFRYPRKLSLVATGDRLEQREDGATRISHWKSKDPIRVAGFNIGEYEEAQAKTADGATVTVYANRELETALDRRQAPPAVDPMASLPNRRGMPAAMPSPPPPLAPQPSAMAGKMARELAQVVDYFSRNFGPVPFGQLNVSPIPGSFGQGWPGLIYLSTSAYLPPNDDAFKASPESAQLYYRSLLPVHEVAHQWWGHVVIPAGYRDEWIVEALASYSAMMWLEQKDHDGARSVREMLKMYHQNLMQKHDDEIVDSIGPLALGYRLNNSRTPSGSAPIYYNKGPWVIHMLRQLMRDPKLAAGAPGADAAFFKFLRALRDEFSTRQLTTAAFRELAEKYVSPQMNAESANKGRSLEWFFDQWVFGTGIPEVKVEAKLEQPRAAARATAGAKARPAGNGKITGTARLENVEETWILPVPIYLQTLRGEVFAGVAVATAGSNPSSGGNPEDARFMLPVAGPANKVLIDPQQTLLAVRK